MTEPERDERSGVSEALRSAIERTFAASADSAAGTRERAAELLDDAARRGQDARDEVARRSQEAREEVTRRGSEAREDLVRRGHEAREAPRVVAGKVGSLLDRLRGRDPAEEAASAELEALRTRVAELERELKTKS